MEPLSSLRFLGVGSTPCWQGRSPAKHCKAHRSTNGIRRVRRPPVSFSQLNCFGVCVILRVRHSAKACRRAVAATAREEQQQEQLQHYREQLRSQQQQLEPRQKQLLQLLANATGAQRQQVEEDLQQLAERLDQLRELQRRADEQLPTAAECITPEESERCSQQAGRQPPPLHPPSAIGKSGARQSSAVQGKSPPPAPPVRQSSAVPGKSALPAQPVRQSSAVPGKTVLPPPPPVRQSSAVPGGPIPPLPPAKAAASRSTQVPSISKASSDANILEGMSALARNKAKWIAQQVNLNESGVRGAVALFEEGATLPFIARYRKEKTGSMNEADLLLVERALQRADALETRRCAVGQALHQKDVLTVELKDLLLAASTLAEVEEIYKPFKSSKKTRAQLAEERGLLPLAECMSGRSASPPLEAAKKFLNAEKGVSSCEDALAGACDILAERWARHPGVSQLVKRTFPTDKISKKVPASLVSKRKSESVDLDRNFEVYWDWESAVHAVRPFQFLAVMRGKKQKVLSVSWRVKESVYKQFVRQLIDEYAGILSDGTNFERTKQASAWEDYIQIAADDAYARLIQPSLERQWGQRLKDSAEDSAYDTYRENLGNKLFMPPLRMHPVWGQSQSNDMPAVLGIDPGFRTGCKIALVSATGEVLATETIYLPMISKNQVSASNTLRAVLSSLESLGVHRVICAVGNGTASMETVAWLKAQIQALDQEADGKLQIGYTVVDEAGASIYSASPLAGEELPELDVSLRGAVSIARRFVDPLSELVKIDPKSIGVGLYQYDVDQKRLCKELAGCVQQCVSSVGVDLNTASPSLLSHVPGLSAKSGRSIVELRCKAGLFSELGQLTDVKGIGERVFHQAAGFLRIYGGEEPLDALAIHPESYHAARQLQATPCDNLERLESMTMRLKIGMETLIDIRKQLEEGAPDPRDQQQPSHVRSATGKSKGEGAIDAMEAGLSVDKLKPGMCLQGIVRNVVEFGAFVDVGVKHDGLVPRKHFAQHKLAVNDFVDVWVISAENRSKNAKKESWKLSLSMKPDSTSR
eukprot:TRINITY_DN5949_c0_g1_i1.p1 TRINITY_DN5949_c0_g1~~TRINITY_DN5949_c0_g1_i1.p1  ORF type:complete len:1045 (+),score=227.14 TRINITY_DN5949_c0_g1_i1:66-3200(+)